MSELIVKMKRAPGLAWDQIVHHFDRARSPMSILLAPLSDRGGAGVNGQAKGTGMLDDDQPGPDARDGLDVQNERNTKDTLAA